MNLSQRCQLLAIFVASIDFFHFSFAEIHHRDNAKNNDKEALSGDFQMFLRDMESRVFKEPPKIRKGPIKYPTYTTHSPNVTKNINMFHSQKAALRDVLMLKLVSYYEDKYKLANQETTAVTTTSTTTSSTTTTTKPSTKIGTIKPRFLYDSAIARDVLNDIEDRISAEVVVI
ncbi:uncharacterized protein LOC128669561 [Plodia interpunctella]|uniref:uncharacterized protein LOC128669561 n=1 Tax=Plodia interpunctella TaxID=58824 RepID=UPI002368461A|nr:uncharacterized protein LOC128669561 [Plodia interpunctella]